MDVETYTKRAKKDTLDRVLPALGCGILLAAVGTCIWLVVYVNRDGRSQAEKAYDAARSAALGEYLEDKADITRTGQEGIQPRYFSGDYSFTPEELDRYLRDIEDADRLYRQRGGR